MLKLPIPNIDNDLLLDNIIKNKRRSKKIILQPFVKKIKERYRYYETHYDSLDKIDEDNTWRSIKNDLLSCYGANIYFSEARKKLVEAMPAVIQNKCPYCMLNRPSTLDHYFDKNKYPEFCIFFPNLLLCCSECNSIKNDVVFDSRGSRKYIHFYHDDLPSYKFLFIRFSNTKEDIVPKINIYIQFQSCEIQPIVQAHFKNLKLFQKYKMAINEKLSLILKEIRDFYDHGFSKDQIKDIIEIRYNSMMKEYGNNYWETCIYEGVINSPCFIKNIILYK